MFALFAVFAFISLTYDLVDHLIKYLSLMSTMRSEAQVRNFPFVKSH